MTTRTALLAALALSCAAAPRPRVAESPPRAPPVARKEPVETVLHGQRRVDEYAWLRRKGTPEVEAYLAAENAWTDAAMRETGPLQQALYAEALARIQQTDLTVPHPYRGWLYYARTVEGLQYPIHCRRRPGPDAPEEVLLDLNQLAAGKKFLGLGGMEPSDDGRLLAFSTDETGFRVYELRIKDLATGELLPERMARATSFAWAADGRTLFYVTEDDAKRPYRLWRHRLGDDPARDALVLEEGDAHFDLDVERTRSGSYLLAAADSKTTSEVRFLPAGEPEGSWRVVAPRAQGHEYHVDHRGDRFWIRTNDRGRNFRLVSAPVSDPGRAGWAEVVPHRPEVMLEQALAFAGHLVLRERRDGLQRLAVLRPERGARTELDPDEPVYSLSAQENDDYETRVFRYGFQSLVTPRSVYEWDLESGERRLLKREPVLGGYDPARYVQERRWATAADGARIPISLVRRADLGPGPHPALLVGYGSYGISLPAAFDPMRVSMLDRGLVFALAHVRGGGELGKPWHDAGRMASKRNTFGDFIACAERLVADGTTAPDRLAIRGGSAGGLLVGAVLNLRPDLFRAAVAQVPFVDVLNTMLDASLPLTVGEFEEWGDPREPAAYATMASYSPYDNVAARDYPALLVVSSYNDSQVMYWEPAKWVARLRDRKTGDRPLLLRMEMEPAGHGGRSGRYERLRQAAFADAFVLWQLGVRR